MTTRTDERVVIEPRLRRRAILEAIRTAGEQLALSIFRSDDPAIWQALAAAVRRGVHVRVLMTPRARAAGPALDALQAWLGDRGVVVRRYAGGTKYHAKYLVADGTRALVTTANLTRRCFETTCDFTLVTRDAETVAGLRALFDADWNLRPLRLTSAQRARLIVGPDHAPRQRFGALASEARERLRIVDSRLSDPLLLRILDEQQRAGVTVERARRRDVRPLRRHGKLLIVDGRAAVLGSFALSPRALDHRRELAIVTRDPRLVAQLNGYWTTAMARRDRFTGTTVAAPAQVQP